MKEQYILSKKDFGLRLARLRESKGISARQMSLEIGQNKNYINSIEIGNNYPTMSNFFDICQYLKITPQTFFQTKQNPTMEQSEFLQIAYSLPPRKFHHLFLIASDLSENLENSSEF